MLKSPTQEMLDYSPQINKYLESQMQHLNPQMQQLLKQMTPKQMNQAVQSSPELQQALQAHQVQDVEPKSKNTQYYLDKLQEEAAEIVQAVSKLRRFGPNNHHPERKTTNLQELVGELEDFLALVACLEADKLIDLTQSQESIKTKFETIYKN